MTKDEPLKRLLVILIELKATMQDTAKPDVNDAIDDAIKGLQLLIEGNQDKLNTSYLALELLGKLFDKLPSVAALINLISG